MLTKDIQENFPFLSVVTYGGNEYIGIIINQDVTVTSMYIYTDIKSELEQRAFLELGEAWWWESNRLIPINLFLGSQISVYKNWIVNINSKDVQIMWGPETSLNNIIQKRIKRRSVQLVRKID